MLNKIIKFFLENKLVTFLLLAVLMAWGVITSPFGWDTGFLPHDPVPVDAIPDIGENQQIVYTEWPGRSPQDVEDQISYPLTTALLGIPGVKTIRSNSIFGVSSIYIIFNDDVEFYWSRSRILEKLNSLPPGTLPPEVNPALGPDATALGQVFWYTLEGRDDKGKPAGGWDPQELRSIQDFYVKYALTSVDGVSEVASIGGFVKEYQIDIDPVAMKEYGVDIARIIDAVKRSNLDIGARTIEFNKAEYVIRSLGYVKSLDDLEKSVVAVNNNVPVRIKDVAHVGLGPASRRGGLDKGGAPAVGGVVVARYGANPLKVINKVKEKIEEIEAGLPVKTLPGGSTSKVTIVPFYDRSGLIYETLGTLEEALSLEVLISVLVVLIMVFNLRASFLISSLLPAGVLMTFIAMRKFGVDANIVALSGIAIAIGVMVDVGVVFTENIIRHTSMPENRDARGDKLKNIIYNATVEVAPAVLTAIATTVISFMPVFALQAAEGKLFRPLAFTKTFVMLAALFTGLIVIPALAHIVFSVNFNGKKIRRYSNILLAAGGVAIIVLGNYFTGVIVILLAANNFFSHLWKWKNKNLSSYINVILILLLVVKMLSSEWMPLGAQYSEFVNTVFVTAVVAVILGFLLMIINIYPRILTWALNNKWKFLSLPVFIVLFGMAVWQGVDKISGFMPRFITETKSWQTIESVFPGIGKEFMPALNEGSFLLMPTTMPHSGVEENIEVIQLLDKKVNSIPEVQNVVGKWGRVNSALDPAPVSMFENIINYKPEYILDKNGHRLRFKTGNDGAYILKDGTKYNPLEGYKVIEKEMLIPDKEGEYFRQWRDNIHTPDDIWNEIVANSQIPGLTSAPKLQPIQTRLIMLSTGMRAPMGIKIFGPDLESIEKAGMQIETLLKNVKGVSKMSVFADRVVGKPYLEIHIDRDAIARYGLTVKDFQNYLSVAVGGMPLTYTVEGRERYPVRVRYAREFRDNPGDLKKLLIPTPSGVQIPLGELASLEYTRGPQMIKSENTFLVSYVIFDKREGFAEVDVVENAQKYLKEKIKSGQLVLPPGVSYKFTGDYENQVRAVKRLIIVIPVALLSVFLILYFRFRSATGAMLVFSGIVVAFSGGFIMLWLYAQPWFMNFSAGGIHLRNLFQIHTVNLSVAVWVGFIALFGIATDDGVLISTYIKQLIEEKSPGSVSEIRAIIVEAGKKRIRPAIMTTATTLLALLPVLTSTGKGADIMVPMAIPIFGGMTIAVLTVFVVPVLYGMWKEREFVNGKKQ